MKTVAAIAIFSMANFGLAGQASAFSLSPTSTKFTASGPTALTANGITVDCIVTLTGKITATGHATVTGFSVTGPNSCSAIVGTMPWTARATSAINIRFSNMAFGVPAIHTCGPGSVNATDNAAGQITFNTTLNPGACMINGTLQSSPPITIVP